MPGIKAQFCHTHYARQHRHDVLALTTRNTDYLVFDDDFEFWSLSDLRIFELKIVKFNRAGLKEMIGLNSLQMQLLCAISHLEPQEKIRICGHRSLIRGCVAYVRRQKYGPNGYDVSELTGDFTEAQTKLIFYVLNKMCKTNNFIGSVDEEICSVDFIEELKNTDENFQMALQFCKKKIYFAYKLMNESITIPKDLLYIDLRERNSAEFIEFVANITLKLCGILFKNVDLEKRPKTRPVGIVVNGSIEPIERDIIYPPSK